MERIRELREERGMTQRELAEAMGIDRTAIAKYETGASGAKSEMLERLATYFGVSTDYLLGRTGIRSPAPDKPESEEAEIIAYLQQIKDDPSTRMMFDLAKGATLEEIRATVAFLKALREQDHG